MSLLFGYSSGLSTIEEDINMNGYKITDLPSPSTNSEPVTKGYADTHYSSGGGSGGLSDTGFTMQGDINMNANKITGLGNPTTGSEPVSKQYGDNTYLTDGGFVMNDNIGMGGHTVTDLRSPVNDTDASTKAYVDKKTKTDPNFNSSGVTMTGEINMGNNKITNLKTPTNNTDACNKKYVDDNTTFDPNFNSSGVTMTGEINMGNNKITNLKTTTNNTDGATKKYVDDNTVTNPNFNSSGVTMSGNIDMGGHTVTNLGTPTNNSDAATKKYVDDKKCKFKDGTTTTEVVDLRYDSVNNRFTFHNDIGFLKAYGTEINSSSLPASLVTLNSLQSGGLLGIKSFSQTIQGLFPHRLIMAKGNVTNFTVIHKDQTVDDTDASGGVSLRSYASGVALDVSFKTPLPNGIYKYIFDLFLSTTGQNVKVFLNGECGGTGYKATTTYEHWSGTAHGTAKQVDATGGYFHRMHGKHIHISGSFRNYGKKIINYGRASAMNETGAYNEFVLQNLTANSDEPVVLGASMTWEFENKTPGSGLTFTTDSYFYIEKVQTI